MEPSSTPTAGTDTTPSDLLTRGVITVFVAAGLGGYLQLTHAWFYGIFSSTLTIGASLVGVAALLGSIGQRSWHPTSLPLSRRIRNFLLWCAPVLLLLCSPWFAEFLRASAHRDKIFERFFSTIFVMWFVYLEIGGRLFAQLLGLSWHRLRIWSVAVG